MKAARPRSRATHITLPASGATDVFAQASVLGLYDPDRSQAVTYLGRPRAWSEAWLRFAPPWARSAAAAARDCAC